MTDHVLDNAFWSSLATRHSHLAIECGRARRYPVDISPFAGIPDASAESSADLYRCVQSTGTVIVTSKGGFSIPQGLVETWRRDAVQLVFDAPKPPVITSDLQIEPLGETDAPQMLALAQMTQPGPFEGRTHQLGQFWGVKQDGQLIAMAGERLRQPGFVEISGVCTHPDHRGKGLGRALCIQTCRTILEDGEIPYLHSFADNPSAIRLYESLGFRQRITVQAIALEAA